MNKVLSNKRSQKFAHDGHCYNFHKYCTIKFWHCDKHDSDDCKVLPVNHLIIPQEDSQYKVSLKQPSVFCTIPEEMTLIEFWCLGVKLIKIVFKI